MAAKRLTTLAAAAAIIVAFSGAIETQAEAVPAPANNTTTFNTTADLVGGVTESVLPLIVLALAAYAILQAASNL